MMNTEFNKKVMMSLALFALASAFGDEWLIPSPTEVGNVEAVTALTNALAQAQAGETVTLSKGVYDLAGFVSHVDATYSNSHLYMPGRKILLRGDPACTRDEVVLKGGGSIRILRIKDGSNGLTKAPAFENLTFTNGVTAYWAGAVYLQGTDADCGYYTNCAFRCCSSKGRCGTAWGGTFSHCYFEGNKAGSNYGGCSSRSTAYDCVFVNNSAAGNGGALNQSSAYRCAFTNNTATGSGGAISNAGTVRDCTFYENSAGSDGGGGCHSALLVSNCVFEANCATTGGNPGAVSLRAAGRAIDCKFYSNWCLGSGAGAIQGADSGTECVTSCVFTNNMSWSGCGVGKGVSVWLNCTNISNSVRSNFEDAGNAGILGGKAVHCVFRGQFNTAIADRYSDARLPCTHIDTDTFKPRNSAVDCDLVDCDVNGSVMGCSAERCEFWGITNTYGVVGDNCYLTNCIIRDNFMPGRQLIVNKNAKRDPVLVNCTVVNNTCRMFATTNAVAVNTIFYNNIDADGWTRMDINCNSSYGVALTNCLYQYANPERKLEFVAPVKLAANETPKFNGGQNPAYPYYMPRHSSRAVGAGSVDVAWATDFGGYPRHEDGSVDIGAYQCWIPAPGLLLIVR